MISPDAKEFVELLPSYSDDMEEEKQKETESLIRAMFLSLYEIVISNSDWSAHFWRRNYEISSCIDIGQLTGTEHSWLQLPFISNIVDLKRYIRRSIERWKQRKRNRSTIQKLVAPLIEIIDAFGEMSRQVELDLYDLDRDDVLFGLLSRQFHFYYVVCTDSRLWIPEYGMVFHRVMADTLIVASYLMKQNDIELFTRFKSYSLGKQKLYKLHLEEIRIRTGFDSEELEEMLADRINEEIMEEFLSIELGSLFEGTNIRDMAISVGLKDLYDMVYAPTSAEVHGEWSSLKEYNLGFCANPLHRMHRLPRLIPEPYLSPGIVLSSSSILADTIYAWLKFYDHFEHQKHKVDQFRRKTNSAFHIQG